MMANLSLVESPEDLNRRYADQFLPLIIYLAVHAVIGIVGNAVVLVVFSLSTEYKNTTFRVFVLCLAALDLLSCVTFIPTEIARLKHFFWKTDDTLCKLKCFFNVFFNTALALALFFIAIHRYRKVCQPFRKQIGPAMALRIVIVVMIASCLLSIPAPVTCGIETVNKTNIYNTSTLVQICAAKTSIPKTVLLANIITITLLLFIVSIALVVLYIFISKTLISQWRKMKTSNVSDARSVKYVGSANISKDASGILDDKTAIFCLDNVRGETKLDETTPSGETGTSTFTHTQVNTNTRASRDNKYKIMDTSRSGKPYKTLIWLVLTGIFIVTNALYVMAAFAMSQENERSPNELFGYKFLIRIYFFNNIINPIIYVWLDRRFRASCKAMIFKLKTAICRY